MESGEPSPDRWNDPDHLIERLRYEISYPEAQTREIEDAIAFAMEAHRDTPPRAGGDPYITHPLRVALAANHHFPDRPEMVIAALLHDTVEDTPATPRAIEERFGPYVAELVDDLTRPPGQSKESFHRSFEGKALDAQELKLLDRCDNLRGLQAKPAEAQEEYLKSTEQIYLPLARKIGGRIQRDFLQSYARATAS